MSTDLTLGDNRAVNPVTGEILALDAPVEQLGALLGDLREYQRRIKSLESELQLRITDAMDHNRAWTIHCDGFKLSGKSDAPVVTWDVEALQEELDAMVAEGLITPEAVGKAIRVTVKYEVVANGMNALLKSHVFAERLSRFRSESQPDGRRVSVSRA